MRFVTKYFNDAVFLCYHLTNELPELFFLEDLFSNVYVVTVPYYFARKALKHLTRDKGKYLPFILKTLYCSLLAFFLGIYITNNVINEHNNLLCSGINVIS